jgi:hypothetical protein
VLRGCESLLRGLAVPRHCLGIVLRDTPSGGVRIPKGDLRACVSLVRGFAVPRDRLGVILRKTLSAAVQIPKGELRSCVSRVRLHTERCDVIRHAAHQQHPTTPTTDLRRVSMRRE